jgi:tetratricopeptide (TPR) repeat protein
VEKTAEEIKVFNYLRRGLKGDLDDPSLAAACDKLIQKVSHVSLKKGYRLARLLNKRAIGSSAPLALTSYRALARTAHMSGKHNEALKAYLKARQLAHKQPLIRARIDRALIDVYMYLGDFANARRRASSAFKIFRRLKAEPDIVQTEVNLANLLHRMDRHRDAERLYRKAGAFFERADNPTAAARCDYNRANALVQLFKLDDAEKLYRKAQQAYKNADFLLEATDARYGLAWLWMLRGKFHQALIELSECEKEYRAGGDPRGAALCLLDKAEVFLALNMYSDAFKMATDAHKVFSRLELRYEACKALLFKGQAALAMEKYGIARKAAALSLSGFSVEKNVGFLGAAHLLAAELADGTKGDELKIARRFFRRAQLPLWEAVCDLRLAASGKNPTPPLRRLSRNRAAMCVPSIYTAWQTMLGDFDIKNGRRQAALKRWRSAANRLDHIRAQLPPLELRSSYSRNLTSPHARLIAANLKNNPADAALWSEKYKTAGIWAPIAASKLNEPVRKKVENSLSLLARQVALLNRNIEIAGGKRGISLAARNSGLAKLQRELRDKLIYLERQETLNYSRDEILLNEIRAASRHMYILQFHLQGDEIIAFVHRDRTTIVKRFIDGRKRIADFLQKWNFILEEEILAGFLRNRLSSIHENSLWKELGDWFWRPLEIDPDGSQILVIPEGELANLPFEAIMHDGAALFESHHFVYSPSFRHFLSASQIHSQSDEMLIFGGVSDDIPYVVEEMKSIANSRKRNVTIYEKSVRNDWPSSGESGIWHYSGHANIRTDNPFYSYLSLADGPLFAVDFRLKKCAVNLVTLAACRSGEQVAMPGEESTGLVRSLLEMGARNVIAGRWPVSDKSAALWMKLFYNKYMNGDNIYNAARLASLMTRESFPSAYHWAAFAISGAGV